MKRAFTAAAAFCLAAACANSSKNSKEIGEDDRPRSSAADDDDPLGRADRTRGETSVSVQYEDSVRGNWLRGEEEFQDENYLAAQKYFSYIRSKFPYSSLAVQAELRMADCLFHRERHIEAVDAYQNFIRLHPTHKGVAYAMRMTGKSYFEQIPEDWFMLPPSEEKDQAAVRDAERALAAYVERFAQDEGIAEGKELLKDVRSRLVAHERYAADFYRNLDKTRAYVLRLEVIRERFADVALDDALLAEIAEAYVSLGEADKAKKAVQELEQKFPQSPKIPEARAALASLPQG